MSELWREGDHSAPLKECQWWERGKHACGHPMTTLLGTAINGVQAPGGEDIVALLFSGSPHSRCVLRRERILRVSCVYLGGTPATAMAV